MAFKINRQRDDSFRQGPVLSPMGKKIIIGGGVALALLLVCIIIATAAGKEERSYKMAILNAVEHSITVCRNSITELGAGADVKSEAEGYINAIQKEKKLMKKSDTAKEMLGYLLGYAQDNTAVQDDLKGAQNRITTAVKDYQKKYGSKKI